jgi:hypothetical protein
MVDFSQPPIQKLEEMLGDPDEGLELREEIKARLRRSLEPVFELLQSEA